MTKRSRSSKPPQKQAPQRPPALDPHIFIRVAGGHVVGKPPAPGELVAGNGSVVHVLIRGAVTRASEDGPAVATGMVTRCQARGPLRAWQSVKIVDRLSDGTFIVDAGRGGTRMGVVLPPSVATPAPPPARPPVTEPLARAMIANGLTPGGAPMLTTRQRLSLLMSDRSPVDLATKLVDTWLAESPRYSPRVTYSGLTDLIRRVSSLLIEERNRFRAAFDEPAEDPSAFTPGLEE